MTSVPVASATTYRAVTTEAVLPRVRRPRGLAGLAATLAGLAVLSGAALFSAASADRDAGVDLRRLIAGVGDNLSDLRWQFAPIVLALAAAHYVATGIAARAAAGITPGLRELTLVQLAAAAANRITPAGIGGATVNARYFTRRGLELRSAVAIVAAVAVIGGLADVLVLLGVVLAGGVLGLGGGLHELNQLATRLHRLITGVDHPIALIVIAVLVAAGFAGWALMRQRRAERPTAVARLRPLADLLRRPADLATLLAASGATTLILAFAFAATTHLTPGPVPTISVGALIVAYMVAAAAGSAVPIPAGLGSTEAALTAVLVAGHVPAVHAVQVVLVFRVITFWLPAAVGVVAARHLRRTGAL
jgi:uncharacterized membrane protein YbhN (UPF0104 family)